MRSPCARSRYGFRTSVLAREEALVRSGRLGLPWIGHPVIWFRAVEDPESSMPKRRSAVTARAALRGSVNSGDNPRILGSPKARQRPGPRRGTRPG